MAADDEQFSQYTISVNDIDKSLLPLHAREPGTDAFRTEVSHLVERDFAEFGGWAKIVVNDKTVQVDWRSDPDAPTPFQVAIGKLKQGNYADGIRLLEILRRHQPDDADVLLNLGMAQSDIGELTTAEAHLRHALQLDPDNEAVLISLGVALARQHRDAEAIDVLRRAVSVDETNPWAHRNLGACLLRLGRADDAEKCFRRAVELNSTDQQSLFGLAQVLAVSGKLAEADGLYRRVIELESSTEVAEAARKEMTRMAGESFRQATPAGVRPDALMYCLGAIKNFEKMDRGEVQRIGFEIAVLGQRGINPNDGTTQYELKSLPGRFTALHLLSLMYVAFKIIAPDESIGFDLSAEYRLATAMHRGTDAGAGC